MEATTLPRMGEEKYCSIGGGGKEKILMAIKDIVRIKDYCVDDNKNFDSRFSAFFYFLEDVCIYL